VVIRPAVLFLVVLAAVVLGVSIANSVGNDEPAVLPSQVQCLDYSLPECR
jgi:hypothetical protein